MKKLRVNLSKQEIGLVKGYSKWYKVVENELRLFINEKQVNDKNQFINIIDWKESKAYLYVDSIETSKQFYEEHKELDVKMFIKSDIGVIYNEYEVKSWGLNDNFIEVTL